MQCDSSKLYNRILKQAINDYIYTKSPGFKKYRDSLQRIVLSKQGRLFYMNEAHPTPSGSVTFIRYKDHYFALTCEHCVRNENKDNYRIIVPSLATSDRYENEPVHIFPRLLHVDKNNDLALFLIQSDDLVDTKRGFIQFFEANLLSFNKHTEVILMGVPGERLEFKYENDDYTKEMEGILLNHITYFTHRKNISDGVHEVHFGNKQVDFSTGKAEVKDFVKKLHGMSGSPAFVHDFIKSDVNTIKFLGITSNGDPSSGSAHILDQSLVVDFLESNLAQLE